MTVGSAQHRRRRSGAAILILLPMAIAAGLATLLPVAGVVVVGAYLLVIGVMRLVSSHRDATTVLSVLLVILVAVPSDVVIRGWGGAGSPTTLFGMACLIWWLVSRTASGQGIARGHQPVHVAIYLFLGSILASFAVAFSRVLPSVEARGADRGLITMLAMSGIALLCADGIHNMDRLNTFLRRLVLAASVLAAIGMLQFTTGFDITTIYKHLPGFDFNAPTQFIEQRSNFRRVQGTAAHPIEFGYVLAITLPIAIHYALHDQRTKGLGRWIFVAIIAAAIPMSVSRSAFVGVAAGGLVLGVGWTWRRRFQALAVLTGAILAMRLAVHGLVGTITNSFFQSSTDPSVIHRQQDLARVGPLIGHYPVLGRGFGTYIPAEFSVKGVPLPSLDNQYVGTLVETGGVGLAALIILLLIAFFTARGARRKSSDPEVKHLGQALAASSAVAIVSFYTFDAFSFGMATVCTFIVLGVSGALWRLAGADQLTIQPASDVVVNA